MSPAILYFIIGLVAIATLVQTETATKGLPVTVHNEKIPPVGDHGGNELK